MDQKLKFKRVKPGLYTAQSDSVRIQIWKETQPLNAGRTYNIWRLQVAVNGKVQKNTGFMTLTLAKQAAVAALTP